MRSVYIEYVTMDDHKVLHQMRAVEEGLARSDTFDNAVRRLLATGFKRMDEKFSGNLAWTNGETEAYIHFGSLNEARANIKRAIHEYSFLD